MSTKKSTFGSPFGFCVSGEENFSPSLTIPGQDLKLSELVQRFRRGEPLLSHTNPLSDMYGEDETLDDAPPEGQDLCEAWQEMQSVRTTKRAKAKAEQEAAEAAKTAAASPKTGTEPSQEGSQPEGVRAGGS